MTAIANCLVTATPNTAGFPTLSGNTNASGVLSLPFNDTITYTLTFTGPALGKVSSFTPAKTTFTFYNLKNKGKKPVKISGQSLAAGGTVFAAHQSFPISIKSTPFVSWSPGTLFVAPKSSKTTLKMPTSSVSIAQVSTALPASLVVAGWFKTSTSAGAHSKYNIAANSWKAIPVQATQRGHVGGTAIKPKFFVVGALKNSVYDSSTNVWASEAAPTKSASYPAVSNFNGSVYVLGKPSGTGKQNLLKYDPTANSYKSLAVSLASTENTISAMGASNSHLYENYRFVSPYTQSYDIATNAWALKATGSSRNLDAWGIGKGVFYVNSGWSKPTHGASYVISKNSWKAAPTYTNSHWRNNDRGNGLVGSNFYIIGGDVATNQTTDNVVYDTASRTFSSKAALGVVTGRAALGQL